jgi:hypothetical protein
MKYKIWLQPTDADQLEQWGPHWLLQQHALQLNWVIAGATAIAHPTASFTILRSVPELP